MTDTQLYLSIAVPVFANTLLTAVLALYIHVQHHRAMAALRRVEGTLGTRLTRIEDKLGINR